MSGGNTLFVISGPSGVGKTTIAQLLLDSDRAIQRSVSYTTRAPRSGEERGIAYNFVSRDKFAEMDRGGDFVETAQVYEDWYGTSIKTVAETLDLSDVLLVLDTKGCRSIKTLLPQASCIIFIVPSDISDLAARLKRRASETEDVMKKRLAQAKSEIKEGLEMADFVVINDDVSKALFDIVSIVRTTRIRLSDRAELGNKLLSGE